jgi:2-octaprenyl-6-methoxyphenol hydroxylase
MLNAVTSSCPYNIAYNIAYDIAIVGGGIVGTLAACALQDSGLRVVLLEAAVGSRAADRGQAYSINLLSSQIFQGLGLWDQIRPQIETYGAVRLSDSGCPEVVSFAPSDIGTATLGYVAEHRVLLAALQARLQDCQNVDWRCPAQVLATRREGGITTLEIAGPEAGVQTVQAKLVIAADGSNSFLRQAAGIRTIGWRYWQSCVVAFIKPEKSHDNIAYERFTPEGPFAILPLPQERCRIVWTAPHGVAERILAMEQAEFLRELTQRYGDQMGELELEGCRSVFPVQLKQSLSYVQPGLALIGDAAHCCHPVGGQGINLGIRDAAALVEVVLAAQAKGEDFASLAVLRRYQGWRQWENLLVLAFTDVLTRMFSNQIWPVVRVRRLGLWGLNHLPLVKPLALRLMLGLTGRVPQLAKQTAVGSAAPAMARATDARPNSPLPTPANP